MSNAISEEDFLLRESKEVLHRVSDRKMSARFGKYLVLLLKNGQKPKDGIYTITLRITDRFSEYKDSHTFQNREIRDATFEKLSMSQVKHRVEKHIIHMKPKVSGVYS